MNRLSRNLVVNVLEPGTIKLGNIKLNARQKLLLYQLHDVNPKCPVADLSSYVDIPASAIQTTLVSLQIAGYVSVDGNMLNVHNKGVVVETKKTRNDDEAYKQCLSIASELSIAIAKAYHANDYNKYVLASSLYNIHTKLNVGIEVLRRAAKWISQHVTDPQFPVIHNPYLIYNKWGYIVAYKRRIDAKEAKPKPYL